MQANTSKCKQIQANVSKCKQMQIKDKQMQANTSKCKQMQAICMEQFEKQIKIERNRCQVRPTPRVNNPSIRRLSSTKWLFEENIDNIVHRQIVKLIRENASKYK